jgi:hypothetical protein
VSMVRKLLFNYNDKDFNLYTSAKYEAPRMFYNPNYYFLPKWADPEKLSFLQAVKIINYRIISVRPCLYRSI